MCTEMSQYGPEIMSVESSTEAECSHVKGPCVGKVMRMRGGATTRLESEMADEEDPDQEVADALKVKSAGSQAWLEGDFNLASEW